MSILAVSIIFTVVATVAIVLAAERASESLVNGLAGGAGAGAGILWRVTLGFDDISVFYDLGSLMIGIGLAMLLVKFVRMRT